MKRGTTSTASGFGRVARRCQRGVAALEFALVAMVLFVCLYIIVSFGAVLYTQQVLSRAAADGALAISASSRNYQPGVVTEVVHSSLARSLVAPVGLGQADANYAGRLGWVRQQVQVSFSSSAGGTPGVVLSVSYPYASNAILPSLPGLNLIMPTELHGRAVVAVGS